MKKIFLGLGVLILMMMVYPNQASAFDISFDPTLQATIQSVSTEVVDSETNKLSTMTSTFVINATSTIFGDVYVGMNFGTQNPLVNINSFEIKRGGVVDTSILPFVSYFSSTTTVNNAVKIPKCTLGAGAVPVCTSVRFVITHTFTAPTDGVYRVTLKKLGYTLSLPPATQKYTNVDFRTNDVSLNGASAISSIQVITPNGGERLVVGQNYPITWSSVGVQNVKIELCGVSATLGAICMQMPGAAGVSIPASQQSYNWWLDTNHPMFPDPSAPTITSELKIKISSVGGGVASDYSNDNFFVNVPNISNVKVNGLKSNKWIGGETKTITWDSVGVDRNVNIVLGCAFATGSWDNLINDGIQRLQLKSDLGRHDVGDDCGVTVFSGAGETYIQTTSSPDFIVATSTPEERQYPSTRIGGVVVDDLGFEPIWFKDQTKTIRWNKASTTASTVDIILCQDRPFYNCWPTMAMNTLNDGSEMVKIWNDTGSATSQYPVYAKVRSVTPQKVGTSTPFSVIAPISNVQVSGLSQTTGDSLYNTWTKGQTKTVTWNRYGGPSTPSIPTVDIFICKASTGINLSNPNERCRGTMNGMVISTNTPNDGMEQINIPTDPNFFKPGNDYEIFVRKYNSPSMGASSTDRFRIGAPSTGGVGQANPNDGALANVLSALQSLLSQLSGLLK